jgi:arsenite oxidase large subunit
VQQAGTNPPAPIGGTERIIGTKRLYADGNFNKPDGRAVFAVTQWRGFQAAGKQEEKDRFPFLITTAGRTTSGSRPTSTNSTSS